MAYAFLNNIHDYMSFFLFFAINPITFPWKLSICSIIVYFLCINLCISSSNNMGCLNLYSLGLLKSARHRSPKVGLIIFINTDFNALDKFLSNSLNVFVINTRLSISSFKYPYIGSKYSSLFI